MVAHPEHLLRHVRDSVPRPTVATEAELLDRFVCCRDEEAFAALVARHGSMVLGVCRRVLRDADTAQDVAQATFLVLARQAATIRQPDSLAAFLHQTARHLALKHLRAETRRRQHEIQAQQSIPARGGVDPLDELTVRELLAIFDEEVQQLPDRYRLPFILCCLEGRSHDEAARQLGWTPGSVKGRLERARARLHVRLDRRGLSLSAVLVGVETARGAMPAGFIPSTLQSVLLTIAEEGIRSTTLPRTKILLALFLAVSVVTAGITAVTRQGQGEQTGEQKQSKAPKESAEKQQARTDRHGDPLPEGAIARLGNLRWRGAGEIEALAFSPDGKTVASGSNQGICLFDADGKLIRHIKPFSSFYRRLAFSQDGRKLACWAMVPAGGDRGKMVVQLWEVLGGRKTREFDVDALQWLGWSPEGEPLAIILARGVVVLREMGTGKERRLVEEDLPEPLYGFYSCAYIPAARVLAVHGKSRTIHVWDVSTNKKRWTLEPRYRIVYGLALTPDGRSLASLSRDGEKYSYQLWDLITGKSTRTVAGDQKDPEAVAFSPDGKTLATVGWRDVRFHDVLSCRERSRTSGVAPLAKWIAFSSDSKTLATTERHSGAIHLWDVTSAARKAGPAGHTNRPNRASFSADGRRVATGGTLDGTIFVWDPTTGEPLTRFRGGEWVRACAFSTDGRTLIRCSTGANLDFLDASSGRLLHTAKLADPDRPDTVQSGLDMHLSDDRKTLVTISLYHASKPGQSVEEELLLIGWDATTRKQLFRRRRAAISLWPVVSADVRMLAATLGSRRDRELERFASPTRRVFVEDLATGNRLLLLPEIRGLNYPLAFSPDGRLLATTTSRNVPGAKANERGYKLRLWEMESGREVLALPTTFDARVAFSPDGRLLALPTARGEVLLWDLRRGKEHQRLKGFDADVTSLAYSPDSKRLVGGLSTSTLLVWEVARNSAKPARLDASAAAGAWTDLAGEPGKAFAARGALTTSPAEAIALLKVHLKPVQPADAQVLRRLLADLDSDSFAAREKAGKELEKLGDRARGALLEALKQRPALEVHRRIQALLARLALPVTEPETLRVLRALAVLEDIGTPECQKILETLAGGAAEARLTLAANVSLERLARRATRQP
jgi:RNA polymerase sigma factor (sigma-70 family)